MVNDAITAKGGSGRGYSHGASRDREIVTRYSVTAGRWGFTDWVAFGTVLACLLPYLDVSPLSNDLQPHFLAIFFGAYIWTRRESVLHDPLVAKVVLFSFFYAGVLFALGGVVSAVSFLLVPILSVLLTHERLEVLDAAVRVAVVAYLTGCIIELVIGRGSLDRFVSNARGSDSRGLHSLASEPSYLSIVAFVALTYFLWRRSHVAWVICAGLLAVLSGSLTGLIPMAVVVLLYSLHTRSIPKFAASLITVVTVLWLLSATAQDGTRIGSLIETAGAGSGSILSDVSVGNRIVRSFGPVALAAEDAFIPHRSGSENSALRVEWEFLSERSDYLVERTSNFLSVASYELGFLALPLVIALLIGVRAPVYLVFAAGYLCVTNVSALTPYVALVFALVMMKDRTDCAREASRVKGADAAAGVRFGQSRRRICRPRE